MKITAAVLERCGQPLHLLDLEIPKLQRGQVLVKIAYSAICRSQLMEINGSRGHDKWLPHLLGHEASGVVVASGPEVTKVRENDEVILTWIRSSGIESSTPKYLYNGRTVHAGPVTTFSNYSIVSENRVVMKPQGLDMDIAVLFGCALATGSGMALNEIHPNLDDTILVLGLGGVGMGALLTLVASGKKNVFAVDRDDAKCALAKSFGVEALNFTEKNDLLNSLKKMVPEGFDYCIEAGGSADTIELGFATLKTNSGTLLFASHPPNNDRISLAPHELISGKKIRGSWGGAIAPDSDIPKLAHLLKETNTSIEKLIENQFSLEQINDAVDLFAKGSIFRPILVMDHP
ncbi:zinc-binding dehydrogenase [Luminiphilus sp.]|nr:zinc-binding dehydrogenase [Luminiphilus sp.]